jgi:hypothetical protein
MIKLLEIIKQPLTECRTRGLVEELERRWRINEETIVNKLI